MNKTLMGIIGLVSLTQVAIAQQKDWFDIIINYKGKDTVLYKDAKTERSLTKDGPIYKLFKEAAFGYATKEQSSTPWNEEVAQKALRRKNVILRYSTLEEAMNAITEKDKVTDTYRLLEDNIREYFNVLSENFPKTNTGMGQKISGAEREEYIKCRAAAEKNLEVAKQNNQSTEGLDYLIKFLDEKLGAKKTILDETNRIMLTTDAEGKTIYAVITENAPSPYGKFADEKSIPIQRSLEHLFNDADSVLYQKNKKVKREYIGSKIGQLTVTPSGNYKAIVFIWQIGTKKEDAQFKATITETYNFTEKK